MTTTRARNTRKTTTRRAALPEADRQAREEERARKAGGPARAAHRPGPDVGKRRAVAGDAGDGGAAAHLLVAQRAADPHPVPGRDPGRRIPHLAVAGPAGPHGRTRHRRPRPRHLPHHPRRRQPGRRRRGRPHGDGPATAERAAGARRATGTRLEDRVRLRPVIPRIGDAAGRTATFRGEHICRGVSTCGTCWRGGPHGVRDSTIEVAVPCWVNA